MFRTEIPLIPDARQLARTARVLTLGSCFADSMGSRLTTYKVAALVNPFGTVFNPLAATLLLRAAAGEPVDWAQHFVEARGRWQSYDLHGSIGAESGEALLARIQELVRQTAEFVRGADVLALTLGTAWVYRLRETGELVSNCHKMPTALFEKELLTTEDIVGSLAEAHALLRRLNPRLRLVLTVSPVRHLRDTLPLNSVSKSVLRLASHYLSELLPDVSYFPAYELLTDDLRDYRFYAADMLHLSAVAEDYVWERFARTYFDAEFGRFRKEWDGIQQALSHRPLHAGAPEHRQFLESTLEKLRRLAGQQVEARAEIRDVERRLLALPPPPRPKPAAGPAPEENGEERIDIGRPNEAELPFAAQPPMPEERAETAEPPVGPAADALRDGRDRGGRGRPDRRNQKRNKPESSQVLAEAQPAAERAPAATVPVPRPVRPSYTDYLVSSAPDLVTSTPARAAEAMPPPAPVAAAPAALSSEQSAEEPAKKKKRRSRGGAKRTARKNAARLTGEQPGDAPAANSLPPLAPATLTEETPGVEGASMMEAQDHDRAASSSEVAPDANAAADEAAETPTSANVEASAPATADPAPAPAPKKRGTGPATKKSKVITKSVPVKRAPRRGAEAAALAAATLAPAPPDERLPVEQAPAELRPDPVAAPAPVAVASTPAQSDEPARPAATKRPPAAKSAKPAQSKAAAAKPKPAKKAAPTASRARKPSGGKAPAISGSAADQPPADVATPPRLAAPGPPGATGDAPPRRRGRPAGTKKAPPNEPAAS